MIDFNNYNYLKFFKIFQELHKKLLLSQVTNKYQKRI